MTDPILTAAEAFEAAAQIADEYHSKALEWAKTVRGLKQHIDETDSSRIAAAIRSLAPSIPPAHRDVLAERRRQIETEGWTPEHDDGHTEDELVMAAISYLEHHPDLCAPEAGPRWPWDEKWWKSTTRRRDLVKAAALILAEIERMDRVALREAEALR